MLSFGKAADCGTSCTPDSCFDKASDRTALAKPRTPDRHRVVHMTDESLLRSRPEPASDCRRTNFQDRKVATTDIVQALRRRQMPTSRGQQRPPTEVENKSFSSRNSCDHSPETTHSPEPVRTPIAFFEDSSVIKSNIDDRSPAVGPARFYPDLSNLLLIPTNRRPRVAIVDFGRSTLSDPPVRCRAPCAEWADH